MSIRECKMQDQHDGDDKEREDQDEEKNQIIHNHKQDNVQTQLQAR